MADAPRPLTRAQIASFIKAHDAIRTVERMSQASLVDTPAAMVDLTAALDDANTFSSNVDARLTEATAASNRLAEAIEQLLLQPALREPPTLDDPAPPCVCQCPPVEDVSPRGPDAAQADDLTPAARIVVIEDDLRPPPLPVETLLYQNVTVRGAWFYAAPVFIADGSVSIPGIAWGLDPNTGFYRIGSDNIGVSCGATKIGDFNSSGFGVKRAATGSFFLAVAGTAGAGGLLVEDTAVADASRPFGWVRANGGALEIGNANRSGTSTTGSTVQVSIAAGGNVTCTEALTAKSVTVTNSTVPANGMYLPAANTVGLSANTTQVLQSTSTAMSVATSLKSTAPTGGVGYGTGAGGTVTQVTSRTTGVTLNKVCGAITLVSAAGSATFAAFTVTNSAVAATDVVRVCQKSGTDKYQIHVTAVAAGSFEISFATTGGTTVEQPVFNFAVVPAVAA